MSKGRVRAIWLEQILRENKEQAERIKELGGERLDAIASGADMMKVNVELTQQLEVLTKCRKVEGQLSCGYVDKCQGCKNKQKLEKK